MLLGIKNNKHHDSEEPKQSRARLFVENMLVYGLGSILAKLVPFLMLPLVTRIMPGTGFFGLADLTSTLVSLAQAFAVMGMYDAMFRMFFDHEGSEYKKRVCSTAFVFVTTTSLIVAVGLFMLHDPISRVFFGASEYSSLVIIAAFSTLVGGNNTIVMAPTRMQNKRLIFVFSNLAMAVISYAVSIPLLLLGHYLIALPVAVVITSLLSLIVFAILNKKWFRIKLFDKHILKEMLLIGIPLMPNFLIYWIFGSFDRIMIINLLGADAAGIFAASGKVGQISQLIYTAFAQGWQYFAFSTMHDNDQIELTSRIYEYLGIISFVACLFMIIIIRPLFRLLFPPEYASGAVSAIYLFLSPLLLMLYQIVANQMLVAKKTWPSFFILISGAASDVLLNFILIPILGIEGAALATLVGYLISNMIALVVITKMKLIAISRKFLLCTAVFAIIFAVWRVFTLDNIWLTLAEFFGFLFLIIFIYRKDISSFVKSKFKKKAKMNN